MPTNQEVLKDFVLEKIASDKLSLITLNNGEVIEDFDHALARIIENCADINTTLEKREINIKVVFQPNQDRSYIPHVATVKYKLAGMAPIEGASDIKVDAHGGGLYAKCRNRPEQQDLFSNVTPIEGRPK